MSDSSNFEIANLALVISSVALLLIAALSKCVKRSVCCGGEIVTYTPTATTPILHGNINTSTSSHV